MAHMKDTTQAEPEKAKQQNTSTNQVHVIPLQETARAIIPCKVPTSTLRSCLDNPCCTLTCILTLQIAVHCHHPTAVRAKGNIEIEWLSEQTALSNEGTNKWMNEWMNEWRDERVNDCMNESMNEWKNERMKEWMVAINECRPKKCSLFGRSMTVGNRLCIVDLIFKMWPEPVSFLRFLCEIELSLQSPAHFVDLICKKWQKLSVFDDFCVIIYLMTMRSTHEMKLSLQSRAHFVDLIVDLFFN